MKKNKEEMVSLSELKPHPKNYRVHPDDQIKHIVSSIKQHGFYRHVVIASDNTNLAGHGITEAAKALKLKQIPVIRVNIKSDSPQALKILVGDNELGKFAGIDDRELTEILRDIKNLDPDGLLGTGFDEMMLANLAMVTRTTAEIKDIDEAAEWVGMPDYEQGEKKFAINIFFETEAERQEYADKNKMKFTKQGEGSQTWSTWWPEKVRRDMASIRFEQK